jgi:hypothetical protein
VVKVRVVRGEPKADLGRFARQRDYSADPRTFRPVDAAIS